jgi:hypothetical protein
MSEKAIGYLLIAIGLLIIILSGLNGYQIFTKQARPINILNLQGISVNLGQTKSIMQPTVVLVSGKDLSDSINLFAHLAILGLFINIGYKIASLGVSMVKKIFTEQKEA